MTGPRFVIDNSVVMAWCFVDESDAYARAVLESLVGSEACAPAVWPLELGNVLVVAERKRRLGEGEGVHFLELVRGMPIRVEQETPERMLGEIVALAREHGLSTYDASYLDLAMRRGLPLATSDAALIRAAGASGVPIFEP